MSRNPTESPSVAAPPHRRRRGIASALAMLYLVLFSTLAIGFYAAFTMATQTAYNERGARRALAAAESGMEFIRYHLWSLNIAYDTPSAELFDNVYNQLGAALNGSANLNGGSIARSGDTILIPGDSTKYIDLNGNGEAFRLSLVRDGNELVVSVIGRTASGASTTSLGRGVLLRYGIFERPSSIFDFGVASKSAINMIGNTAILGSPDPAAGSVLSTAGVDFPLTMGSNCEISGEVSFSNPDAWVDAGANAVINNEVGEPNWSDSVHHVPEPDFPEVNTNDYLPYATTVVSSSTPPGTQFVNVNIAPGTNPTFAAGTEIWGVMYIRGPNIVKFAGHVTVRGIIVVENDADGDFTTNKIEFLGTVDAEGTGTLPTGDSRFAGLHEMGGAFILADNFSVKFGGTAATTESTEIAGSIVADKVEFDGTADVIVDGSIINLEPNSSVHFSGKSSVVIKSSGTSSQPHGLYVGSRYVPLPGSYEEVAP